MGTLSLLSVNPEDSLVLYTETVTQISRVLESESHERTLCAALEALQKWTVGLHTTMPTKILEIFKVNKTADLYIIHIHIHTTFDRDFHSLVMNPKAERKMSNNTHILM